MPVLIGHRGASHDTPENTLLSFSQARERGADGIELDVQLSRDNQAVLFHDLYLDKLNLPGSTIHHLDWEDLRQPDAGSWKDPCFSHCRLIRLSDAFEKLGNELEWCIEIKTHEGADADTRKQELCHEVIRVIHKHHITRCHILCFDAEILSIIQQNDPALPLALNCETPPDPQNQPNIWPHLSALSHNIKTLDENTVRLARQHKLKLFAWTCNSNDEVNRAKNFNVDFCLTDDLKRAQKILSS